MTSVVSYALEHFYYGNPANQPQAEMQLLASSHGVNPEHVTEAARFALIPPMPGNPTGSWALVRGRQASAFWLAQAQQHESGQTVIHYVLMPSDVLRATAGNLKALAQIIEPSMPTFEKQLGRLKQLILEHPPALSAEEQIDDILDLMSYTHNQIDIIETLLSGVVQGVPVVVSDAPPDLQNRVKFIQGMLALLPPSARFGVTFSTYTLENTQVDTQIRFFGGEKHSRQTLVYSWTRAKMGGNVVHDDYSRFISSQLRLDAELVIRQTRALTAVAAWRIKRGEGLADALKYASYRFKLDDALLNSQPVEAAEAAKVLSEDPTLTDELKARYNDHVLSFALALGDMQYADPIAVTLRNKPELERPIQAQLGRAIGDGKSRLVYDALSKWMANPLGPVGTAWVELTHRAALGHMEALVQKRNLKEINRFLETLHLASPGLEISKIVPRLIEMTLPLSVHDLDLNLTVFLIAVNYLESDVLRRLISAAKFTAKLPPTLGRLAPYLIGEDKGTPPSGLLLSAASDFGAEWRDPILIRLAEAAIRAKRPEIVDNAVLGAMVGLLGSNWGIQYSQTINWIAMQLSTDEVLTHLEQPGPTSILQLILASGGQTELANEMLHQARILYPGDKQNDYVAMIQHVFSHTPLPAQQVAVTLKALKEDGIRSLPLLMAYIGSLEGHGWATALDPIAEEATQMLFENPGIVKMIPSSAVLSLIKFHIKRQDVEKTIRVSGMLSIAAAREGSKGINLIGRMFKMMDWDDRTRLASLEVARRYVRHAIDADARRAIEILGREYGQKVSEALETTFAIKQLLGGIELAEYAEFLHTAAQLLYDTALTYSDKAKIPTIGGLMSNLDSMGGNLSREDRLAMAEEIIDLGKAIALLGKQWAQYKPRDTDQYVNELLNGQVDPAAALDVFWIMSGYLSKGRRQPVSLQRILTQHPFAERPAPIAVEETKIAGALLETTLKAFPPNKKVTLSAPSITAEMDSLWGDIPLEKQREIVRDLAADFQRVAELTMIISESGNIKVLEDSGAGRKLEQGEQQPKNTLEMFRFVSGYFKARA